jgi:hypothetical protein
MHWLPQAHFSTRPQGALTTSELHAHRETCAPKYLVYCAACSDGVFVRPGFLMENSSVMVRSSGKRESTVSQMTAGSVPQSGNSPSAAKPDR